jgi:hypothetical protein
MHRLGINGLDATASSFLFSITASTADVFRSPLNEDVLERVEDGDTLGEESEYLRPGRARW